MADLAAGAGRDGLQPRFPRFSAHFRWGTATSAYQIEGAVTEGGRGRSVWDTFAATPGKTARGETGEIACDHYRRYHEDIALMADLGVSDYRFSLAWPRIQPVGAGPANPAGLDFYDRLVDALLNAGITPVATLYHWDTPQAVEDAGGWMSRDTAHRFADYATLAAEALSDRIRWWITLNEPVIVTLLGYGLGTHAPGRNLMLGALPTAHHQLLGHGLATQALRAAGAEHVGIANNHMPVWADSQHSEDVAAAAAFADLYNWLFADPLLTGAYPDLRWLDRGLPEQAAVDLPTIAQPLDFYGLNYYSPARIRAAAPGSELPFELVEITGYPRTASKWPVVPAGLRETLVGLTERYRDALPPILITENGCSTADPATAEGTIDDQDRIDFLHAHVAALCGAMDEGVDVRGYFIWSLLDNFEWAEGYGQRFGLVHVDFETQRRTPKASYHWLRRQLAGTA
ncbi:GH1 family beta-glucosidase [Longimycelium tulufanense]|uniref:GH1 family beta-glucosidase n=1 Tax=Longimycelium tulufanense TaxID=907463 RepID=UPI003570F6C6